MTFNRPHKAYMSRGKMMDFAKVTPFLVDFANNIDRVNCKWRWDEWLGRVEVLNVEPTNSA